MSAPKVGEVWRHFTGLTLRVIGERTPGDRYDDERTYCEVIERYTERLPQIKLDNGWEDYDIGFREGWYLMNELGWEKVG